MSLRDLAERVEGDDDAKTMAKWKKVAFAVIFAVMVLSAGARAFLSSDDERSGKSGSTAVQEVPATGPQDSLSNSLVGQNPGGPTGPSNTTQPGVPVPGPGAASEPAEDDDGSSIEGALPFLTEGSFFALIGFALGYASRKILKILLFFVAVFFVGLQALQYADILSVDWSKMIGLFNKWILNIKENESFTQIITNRIPSGGGLIAGYWLGFRRG